MIPWPDTDGKPRRASINSFGYGGANAHAIIQEASAQDRIHHVSSFLTADEALSLDGGDEEGDSDAARPYTLVLSANDANSLKANIQALCNHLINPRVKVALPDLAYTLSERRSRLWHRAFVTTRNTEIDTNDFTVGKKNNQELKIGFVFTGQGAQWPQMGKDLLQFFPWTRSILEELDRVLQSIRDPPTWSLVSELTELRSAEHIRQPEFSQPLVTAIQLCIIAVLETWGVRPSSVVGHSSGEIAAAYAAGFLDRASAIKAAFYRGRAAVNRSQEAESDVGMLAVGLSAEAVIPFLDKHTGRAWVACFNSPSSLTVSGKKAALEALAEDIKAVGHFARLLQVDLAYHSELMGVIGEEYETLLAGDDGFNTSDKALSSGVSMFSSVTSSKLTAITPTDALYWKTNMVSPVRFNDALKEMVSQPDGDSPDVLIEVGPSGALAGPVSQILKSLPNTGDISYCASWSRGENAVKALFDVAGRLFVSGGPIDVTVVNGYNDNSHHPHGLRTIVDLPNYSWNHSVKYWHENAASKDWRFRQFINHDLIGSKIFGTSWHNPTWRKHLMLDDVPWLRDHKMGPDVLIPGAGLATMAIEAMYQKYCGLHPEKAVASANELAYRLRNVRFDRALVVEEGKEVVILLTLTKVPGSKDWHEFRISTSKDDVVIDHCFGLVRVADPVDEKAGADQLAPLKSPQPFTLWYKAQRQAGMFFGPSFLKVTSLEATSGQRTCRAMVDLTPPKSKWDPQSYYPFHPAVLDACLQVAMPANASNERSLVKDVIVPGIVNEAIINKVPYNMRQGLAIAKSGYTGRGRPDQAKSIISDISIYDPETGAMFMQVKGLNYVKLDVGPKPDPHTFDRVSWKPDISLVTQDQLMYLTPADTSTTKLDEVIDLIAHKKAMLKVLEVNLDEADTSCLWFEKSDRSARLAYSQYDFAASNAKTIVTVQTQNEANRHSSFLLMSPEKEALGLANNNTVYDLAIVKGHEKSLVLEDFIKKLKPLLSSDAFTLLVQLEGRVTTVHGDSDGAVEIPDGTRDENPEDISQTPPTEAAGTPSSSDTSSEAGALASSISSAPMDFVVIQKTVESTNRAGIWNRHNLHDLVKSEDLDSVLEVIDDTTPHGNPVVHYLCRNRSTNSTTQREKTDSSLPRNLIIARLSEATPPLSHALQEKLEASGWSITQQHYPFSTTSSTPDHPSGAVVLVLDELSSPVLTQANERQWETLKALVGSGSPLLWVTKGSQHAVTEPDNALVHGLFRVARREEAGARLTTLDVQSSTSPATAWAVDRVLQLARAGLAENEYAERDGVLLVQRVVPDAGVNAFKRAEVDGLEPVVKGLHETDVMVQIRAERVGSLELTWCENHVGETPVEPGFVEVEVMAVGVNFKDVATTMGIVPENEYMIGCECAGVVKRVGPGVTKFQAGDRVAVMRSGTYANRLQAPVERTHVIPSWMSFEDAATIPLVYMTALYSMFHLGNLREGQVSTTKERRAFHIRASKGMIISANTMCLTVGSYPLGCRRCRTCRHPAGSIQKGRDFRNGWDE